MAHWTLICRIYGMTMQQVWDLTFKEIEQYAYSAMKQLELEGAITATTLARFLMG